MMKYCGRKFSMSEIGSIQELLDSEPALSRYRLSIKVCEILNWRSSGGRLKGMSCRVAMLRMEADGLFSLPPPKKAKPPAYKKDEEIERLVSKPDKIPVPNLNELSVEPVTKGRDSLLWNAYIEQHHYLGHKLIPGAQLRYTIRSGDHVVALISFGASAWKTKPRDDYIGWNSSQREKNLHLVINNSRFLILPWIKCRNLASKTLAMVKNRIQNDWYMRYTYYPLLLETFVEDRKFSGTCYKAANWRCVGKTQGRGKLDKYHKKSTPVKSIWVQPLQRNFRQCLCK
jgi:hypothetical protein